jgi:hypothetical protein
VVGHELLAGERLESWLCENPEMLATLEARNYPPRLVLEVGTRPAPRRSSYRDPGRTGGLAFRVAVMSAEEVTRARVLAEEIASMTGFRIFTRGPEALSLARFELRPVYAK